MKLLQHHPQICRIMAKLEGFPLSDGESGLWFFMFSHMAELKNIASCRHLSPIPVFLLDLLGPEQEVRENFHLGHLT